MPIEKTITLYAFEELSDRAKENARAWWRGCIDENDFEFVISDFLKIVRMLGFEVATHPARLMSGVIQQDPNIWWSLGYTQSDYAGFEGHYCYAKGSVAVIKSYAPKDAELHAIAESLQEMQRKNGYQITALFSYSDRSGYTLKETLRAGRFMYGSDAEVEAEEVLRECLKDLSHWLYNRLREQNEYLSEDAQVDEAIAINEYTFTEDGEREDP